MALQQGWPTDDLKFQGKMRKIEGLKLVALNIEDVSEQ